MAVAWTATAVALTAVGLVLALAIVATGLWLCCRCSLRQQGARGYSVPEALLAQSLWSSSYRRSVDRDESGLDGYPYGANSPVRERIRPRGAEVARERDKPRSSPGVPEQLIARRVLAPELREEHDDVTRLQDQNPREDDAAFVGKGSFVRSRAALEAARKERSSSLRLRMGLLFSFANRVLRVDNSFFSCEGASSPIESCLKQIVRLQTTVATAISINRALDAIGGTQSGWREQLEREVSRQLERLSQRLEQVQSSESDAIWGLKHDRQRLQAAILLFYELQEQDYAVTGLFPNVLPLLRRALVLVATREDDVIVPVSQPTWFDPCLLLQQVTGGGTGSERSVWQIGYTDVGVSLHADSSSVSEEEGIRRAALWSKLHHPNVVALEAASYVGTPFFVYAHGIPLSEVVNAERSKNNDGLKWTRLHEAALGLQYLQSRDIAFHALTAESIVVVGVSGDNEKREHTKSGSVICKVNCDRVMSLRRPSLPDRHSISDWQWLAPERLEGGPASLEADVFSFGLCILHVLTGGELWTEIGPTGIGADGTTSDRSDVHPRGTVNTSDEEKLRIDKQCNGKLPGIISSLDEDVRDLVCKMCARDLEERVSIAFVVAQLQRLAEAETDRSKNRSRPVTEDKTTPTTVAVASLKLRDGLSIKDAISTVRRACIHPSDCVSVDLTAMHNSVLERVDRLVAGLMTHSGGFITTEAGDLLAEVVSRLLVSSGQNFKGSVATSSSSTAMSWLSASYGASTAMRRQSSDICRSLHQQLDRILSSLDAIHQQDSVHSDWRTTWDSIQPTDSHKIQMEASQDQQGHNQDAEEKLIVLQFEDQHHAASYTQEALVTMRQEIDRLEQQIGLHPLPNWFLPAYEVEFDALDAFAQGSFGSVHRGRWLDTSVVVKKVFASGNGIHEDDTTDQAVFVREADIWSSLKHENVVQLYGACHLRGQRFFVCEFAPFGTLDAYLRSQRTLQRDNQSLGGAKPKEMNVWRLLYGVGCGLKFLHQRGIAHGDLKCNNVLIGRDETPKLTDFGLSETGKGSQLYTLSNGDEAGAEEADKPTGAVGAYRWKAPEVLRGEVNTSCEADVFSFGMVIVEAVTGDVPWGRDLPDAAVKYHVMNGQLPLRPRRLTRGGVDALIGRAKDDKSEGDEFADDEWELVLAICRLDPSARLPLREAVSRILQFSLRR